MLVRLMSRDWQIISRGIFALFACIIAGSIIVEIQLNQLTYWLDFVQVFNIKQAAGGEYLAYFLGGEYTFQAVLPVGKIANTNQSLDMTLLGFGISIPTKLHIDASELFAFMHSLWQQGIEQSFAVKRSLSERSAEFAPTMNTLHRQAEKLVRQIPFDGLF